ncbi:GDH/6PGL endoplasmic bifunctional protein [Protopterus annectens]|uniref:GDH/6PGL endoplasmic bifunctional protein n=1 Tax=Protopterus annectens TaxID=7888 RepID=UPI001CFB5F51|nr:GDH/6PGL endoplasmic bifunctional protein [Protopterus annectens]
MQKMNLFLVLCGLLLHVFLHASAGESKGHISVVLMGATGDLAKKYLWQSLFRLYIDESSRGYSFFFYGAALSKPETGRVLMFQVLKELTCPPDVAPERCNLLKSQFLRLSQYLQLKTDEDYKALNKEIESTLIQEDLTEAGRLFYLSVPPFAYADIASKINSTCRPNSGAWIRVVLEKPFGHDYNSALELAKQLQNFFQEEEIYRVDHYLGKQAISHILPFRHDNRQFLEPIWNQHYVERVEIVMKETVDAKGRISFYEKYGVIRDVIQNHLTETLMYIAMEQPKNLNSSQEIVQNKLQLFGSLHKLHKKSAVIGQYQQYQAQVQEELEKTADYTSKIPTFAGVLVYIDNVRWDGIPFILTSGKALDERAGYVRVLFKNKALCVQNESARKTVQSQCDPKQIIFYIGYGDLKMPAILISKNLFKPIMPMSSWKEVRDHLETTLFGQSLSQFYIYTPVMETETYESLVSNIFHGKQDYFITTEHLLASWKFWTPLLNSLMNEDLRIYPGGPENKNLLDFVLSGKEIMFAIEQPVNILSDMSQNETPDDYKVMQSLYRNSSLVSAWAEQLISELASYLQEAAEHAVKQSGVFHLALSGGSSPVVLFQRLVWHHHSFPWKQTHLWMVDERCVPLTDPESNFRNVHDNLVQYLKIPYFNIHPMPVHMQQRLCAEEDKGTEAYASDITALVNDTRFDFVLLGVGTDGHTASLFPNSNAGLKGKEMVVFTESPIKPHQRMSLSLSVINRAKQIGVLVTGRGKHDIVTQISRVGQRPKTWPITGVQPKNGKMVWFIDYEALLM